MRAFKALLLILALMTPAFAYTQEQVAACMPDAIRLCSEHMPDEDRVARCLFQKRKQLSTPCTVVFKQAIAAYLLASK